MAVSALRFHHLGLAVRQRAHAQAFLEALGYTVGETLLDPSQNVNSALCTHPDQPQVEILWPTSTKGPLDGMLQRHGNGIVYHVCYVTHDLPLALSQLEAAGLNAVCISPPTVAPLFGEGRTVSFYNVVGMGLIEILA